eukprot:1162136-Pelagomonas_calceolata.AAC.17
MPRCQATLAAGLDILMQAARLLWQCQNNVGSTDAASKARCDHKGTVRGTMAVLKHNGQCLGCTNGTVGPRWHSDTTRAQWDHDGSVTLQWHSDTTRAQWDYDGIVTPQGHSDTTRALWDHDGTGAVTPQGHSDPTLWQTNGTVGPWWHTTRAQRDHKDTRHHEGTVGPQWHYKGAVTQHYSRPTAQWDLYGSAKAMGSAKRKRTVLRLHQRHSETTH